MLVLTRCSGETVDISVGGRTIEVKIIQVKGGQVRLGFEADKDVIINRREITEKIEDCKAKAEKAETKDRW